MPTDRQHGRGESGIELAGSAMRKGQSAWRMANQREFLLHHLPKGGHRAIKKQATACAVACWSLMERRTGLEPATISLEG